MQKRRIILSAVLPILITIGVMWFSNRAVTPKDATWEDVLSEAKNGGYKLITTVELSGQYQSNPDKLLLIDTRQEWEYRTGHFKGALNFPIEPTWWSRWSNSAALETFLGPDKDRTVIFY